MGRFSVACRLANAASALPDAADPLPPSACCTSSARATTAALISSLPVLLTLGRRPEACEAVAAAVLPTLLIEALRLLAVLRGGKGAGTAADASTAADGSPAGMTANDGFAVGAGGGATLGSGAAAMTPREGFRLGGTGTAVGTGAGMGTT